MSTSWWDARTYAVGHCAAHGSDHGDAAAVAPADHLFRDGLGGHEDSGDVDFEHHVGVCLGVVERGSLLLDAGGGDQAVQSPLRIADALDDLVQALYVPHVDLAVVEGVAWV